MSGPKKRMNRLDLLAIMSAIVLANSEAMGYRDAPEDSVKRAKEILSFVEAEEDGG